MALPNDLIVLILLKLLVKSLSRSKCVSKAWYDLITDANFFRKQADYVKETYQERETYIVWSGMDEFETMVYDENTDDPVSGILSFHQVDVPAEFVDVPAIITSNCDGLLCVTVVHFCELEDGVKVRGHKSVYLWNPSMRDFKRLPSSRQDLYVNDIDASMEDQCFFGNDLYGIGHNPSLNDYYICKIPSQSSRRNRLIELLYLKSNYWKVIGQLLDYNVNSVQPATFLNGNLHWLAYHVDTLDFVMLYFNAVKEKFGVLALPQREEDLDVCHITLDIFQGDLCLTERCHNGVQFWIYKDSWAKVISVPCHCSSTFSEYYEVEVVMKPLCITRRNIYLAEGGSRYVVKHNPVDQTASDKFRIPVDFVYQYAETLVSPSKLLNHG